MSSYNLIIKYRILLSFIGISIILLYTDSWLLSNSYFVIFELGGPPPLHAGIWLINSYLSYFENLGIRGLYGIGWPSYLILYAMALSSKLHAIGFAERLWFLSDIFVSLFFSYKLFNDSLKNKFSSYVLALAYTFSPATAVLIYSTSWETFLFYAFSPLIIYLSYKTYNELKLKTVSFDLILVAVFMYIYYFDAGIVLQEGVLIILLFVYFTLININKIKTVTNSLKLLLFLSLFIFFSNSIGLIQAFILGHSTKAFSGTDFGAPSYIAVLTDLESNFRGYWAYTYAYFFWITTIISLLLYIHYRKKIKMKEIILSLISFNFLILIIWTIYVFNIEPLNILLSRFIPVVGEYSFSSVFTMTSNMIIIIAIFIQLLPNYDLKKIFNIKKFSKKEIITILFVVIILISSLAIPLDYGHTNFPSQIELHNNSQKFLNNFDVPKNISILSNWFYTHTDLHSGYRIYLGPVSTSTDQSISHMMDFTSTINLSTSAAPAIGTMEYNGNLTPLAAVLAMEGVQYFIIYKGPNVNSNINFTGPASFSQYGWPWQLSYEPMGSWENWTKLLNESTSFKLVKELPGSFVYEDKYYDGIVYAYNLTGVNYNNVINNSLNPTKYGFYGNNIEYFHNSENITNWSYVNYSIWSINNESNSYKIINTSKHFETSITSMLNVSQGAYYYFKYLLKGYNMTYSVVMIRWYNSTGVQIGIQASNDWSNPWVGNITEFKQGAFLVRAPRDTVKAEIQLVVNIINGTKTVFKNVSVTDIGIIKSLKLNYTFIKPYYISIKNISKNSLVVLNVNYYNGWEIYGTNFTSAPFNNHMYIINSIYYNGNKSNITIILTSQYGYKNFLKIQWSAWISLFALTPLLYLMDKRRKL